MRCSISFISPRKWSQENPAPCFRGQLGKQAHNLPIRLSGKAYPLLFKGLKIIVKTSFPSNSKEVLKRTKYKQNKTREEFKEGG